MSDESAGPHSRTIVLFGASGQIGSALARVLHGRTIIRPTWFAGPAFADQALAALPGDQPCDLVFAGGVTDWRLPEDHIRESNTLGPQRIISATADRPHVRYLTLGTVMENFPEACAANPYLRSKLALGRWLLEQVERPEFAGRICHVRMHTIYGGPERRFLKPHMFLGQLAAALEAGTDFQMSSGDQLREYHHTDDIAVSLAAVLDRDWSRPMTPALQINSGRAIRLGDLAREIFRAFGREDLLKIGSIPRAPGENLDQVFPRSEPWLLPVSREPIAGVIEWLRACLGPAAHGPTARGETPGRSPPPR